MYRFKKFDEQFYMCVTDSADLVIIDTSYSFEDCNTLNLCGKKIVIKRSGNIYNANQHTGKEPANLIVLTQVLRERKQYIIKMWKPYNNATLTIRIRGKKQKYFLLRLLV